MPRDRLGNFVPGARSDAGEAHLNVLAHLSDREVGLRLDQFSADTRSLIFPYRKQGGVLLSGRTRQAVFRNIRPTANELAGYAPSYAINRVLDESM